MASEVPKGKVDLRLWSDDVSLRPRAAEIGLLPKHIHDKGGPVVLHNGTISARKADKHYIGYESADLQNSAEANQRIGEILDALRGAEVAKLIASGAVNAEITMAAFHGDVDWDAELDPDLVEAARAANVGIVVCHYDKFTEEGAPLAVWVLGGP